MSLNVDLAADACGRLWMIAPTPDGLDTELYRIDPSTGAAQLQGILSTPVVGLAASGEVLYGMTDPSLIEEPHLVTLDPHTLTVGEIALLEGAQALQTWALDFRGDGILVDYGGIFLAVPAPPLPRIWQFDLSGETGQVISYPSHDSNRHGLAVAPPPGQCVGGSPLPVPAASSLGLALLSVIVAAAGALILSRWR